MNPARWQRIKDAAAAAFELEGDAREHFLDKECGTDQEFRRAVEEFLEGDEQPGDTVEKAIAGAAAQLIQSTASRRPDRVRGQTISHYKVIEKLGEGGMGVVYKAMDTKLERPVALKFLAAHAIEDHEHKARFIREAKAAARLDHQNICPIYEIDEADGQTFLSMAYLAGQTLKDKIVQRPLKLDEALDIAIQTAQGLKVAHQKEIVHRDIKPANLMLTEEGQVKIMDFGLAQLADRSRLTKTATILGTPAYMSPEQAQRQPTDRRTDIWSLGIVIYEMVTGRVPFEGERQEAVLYAIGAEDPEPITAQRAGLPMELEWIVGKALAKDAGERYQHVDEMIVDLKGLNKKLASATPRPSQPAAMPSQGGTQGPAPVHGSRPSEVVVSKRKLRLQQVALAATIVFALAVSLLYLNQSSPEAPLRRFAFSPPVPLSYGAAISPNGKHIAFAAAGADEKLWVQDLDQREPRAIEGTEGAGQMLGAPFWSPESDFVGFTSGGQLMKVSVEGGLAIRLCGLPGPFRGATWSPGGESIVFSSTNPYALYEVPSAGGAPKRIVSQEERSSGGPWGVIVRPHFLPTEAGPRVLVFSFGSPRQNTMMVQDLVTGRREVLGPGNFAFYSSSGHLLHQPNYVTDELWALPFSLETLTAAGEAFPISESGFRPTVAADQTLVFADGREELGQRQLVWSDRHGRKTGPIAQEYVFGAFRPSFSPDGRLVAFSATQNSNLDVWIWDIARGVKSRLTTAAEDDFSPSWSPTGEEIAFHSNRAGNQDIFSVRTDGSSEPKSLVSTAEDELAPDWSRDGKYLLYERVATETGVDLWYLERDEESGDWEPRPFLQTPFAESDAQFSPDVRYVAYVSDETGRDEVYVRSFPGTGRKWTVSTSGGAQPRWSRDGKELFYVEESKLIAVSISTSPSFSVQSAAPLPGVESSGAYDISPDGQRILSFEPVGEPPEQLIRVVQNWYEEFRDHEQD